jgi:hypothetical protein
MLFSLIIVLMNLLHTAGLKRSLVQGQTAQYFKDSEFKWQLLCL